MPNVNDDPNENDLTPYQKLLDQRKAYQEALDAAIKDSNAKEEGFLMGTLDPSMEKAHSILLESLRVKDQCQRNLSNIVAIILKFEKENSTVVSLYNKRLSDNAQSSSSTQLQSTSPPSGVWQQPPSPRQMSAASNVAALSSSAPLKVGGYRTKAGMTTMDLTKSDTTGYSTTAPHSSVQQSQPQGSPPNPQQLAATTNLGSPPLSPRTKDPRRQAQIFTQQQSGNVTNSPSNDPRNLQTSPQRAARPPSPAAPINTEPTARPRAGAVSEPRITAQPSPPATSAIPEVTTPQPGATSIHAHSTTEHVMEELAQGQKNVDPMQGRLQPIQLNMDLLRHKINACEARMQQARKDGSYLSPEYVEQFNKDKKEINRLAKEVRSVLRPETDNIAFHTRDKTVDTLPKDYVAHVKAMQGVYDSLMLSMHEMETPVWEARLNALKENPHFTDLQRHIDTTAHAIDELSKKPDLSSQDKERVNEMINACDDQLKIVSREVGSCLNGMEQMTSSMKQIMQKYPVTMNYETTRAAKMSSELTKIQHENSFRGNKIHAMRERLDAFITKLDNPSPASSPRGTAPS